MEGTGRISGTNAGSKQANAGIGGKAIKSIYFSSADRAQAIKTYEMLYVAGYWVNIFVSMEGGAILKCQVIKKAVRIL